MTERDPYSSNSPTCEQQDILHVCTALHQIQFPPPTITPTMPTPKFLYLVLTSTLGPLLFGYHLAELNAPSSVLSCSSSPESSSTTRGSFLPPCLPMTPSQFGLITSSFTLGGLVGALSAGPLTARTGRLRCMIYASLLAFLGPVFESLAPNMPTLTLGRFLSGIGAGAATVVVPIYISEISPPERRGFWGSATQIMTNVGILLTQALGWGLSRGALWRVILAVGGVIAGLMTVGLGLGGVESPQWLVDHGREVEAKKVLRTIRGQGVDLTEEIAGWTERQREGGEGEDEEHEEEADMLLSNGNSYNEIRTTLGPWAVLQHPETRTAVFAVCMIMLAQQLTGMSILPSSMQSTQLTRISPGINSIIMYGVSLLSTLLPTSSALLNIALAAINLIVTTTCAPLADSLGRKTCLLISISGMGSSSLLLAIAIQHSIPILSAIAVILFVASFGFGLGPIPFILASELVDGRAVGATQSWALAVNWVATFAVAQFFPILNVWMGGGKVYFLFAAMAVGFAGFVAAYVPETRGKASVDEVWGR